MGSGFSRIGFSRIGKPTPDCACTAGPAEVNISDLSNLRIEENGHLSDAAFDLTPSNNPFLRPGNAFFTTNYDRTIVACYNIGEYMSIQAAGGGDEEDDTVIAAWGDNRRTWVGPPDSVVPGPHAQADVFFTRLGREKED